MLTTGYGSRSDPEAYACQQSPNNDPIPAVSPMASAPQKVTRAAPNIAGEGEPTDAGSRAQDLIVEYRRLGSRMSWIHGGKYDRLSASCSRISCNSKRRLLSSLGYVISSAASVSTMTCET
jgi:hypothetical protein